MERWKIGSIEITKVPKLVLPLPLEGLLPDATAEDVGTHFAAPTAGRLVSDGDGWRLEC
jgi:hypothetical protein